VPLCKCANLASTGESMGKLLPCTASGGGRKLPLAIPPEHVRARSRRFSPHKTLFTRERSVYLLACAYPTSTFEHRVPPPLRREKARFYRPRSVHYRGERACDTECQRGPNTEHAIRRADSGSHRLPAHSGRLQRCKERTKQCESKQGRRKNARREVVARCQDQQGLRCACERQLG
jgi:hypothetical protein